jgi:hypothetical protein
MTIYIKEHILEVHYTLIQPLGLRVFYNLLKLRDLIVPFIFFVKHWKNVIKSNFSSTKCEGISTKKNPSHPSKNLKEKTSRIIIIIFLMMIL